MNPLARLPPAASSRLLPHALRPARPQPAHALSSPPSASASAAACHPLSPASIHRTGIHTRPVAAVAAATGRRHQSSFLSDRVIRATCRVGESRGQPIDLYHEIHGTGKHKLLFITGWAGSCDNWRFQTEFFGRHGDFEVCIYENRGSGFSTAPLTQYRMVDMARDANELVAHLGWDKCHVVGVSMGGMIAQELALLLPDKLSSLCLASTHAGRGLPPSEHIPRLVGLFAQVMLGLAQIKDHVPRLLYSNDWLRSSAPIESGCKTNFDYMLKFHSGRVGSRPPQNFRSALAQLWGICRHYVSTDRLHELRKSLSATSIPVMVVHGTEDCLVHARNALHLARHIGGRLVLFDGRGHAMNHEDIATFNALLLRHFYTAICGEQETASVLSGWANLRQVFETHAVKWSDRLAAQMLGTETAVVNAALTAAASLSSMASAGSPPANASSPSALDQQPSRAASPLSTDRASTCTAQSSTGTLAAPMATDCSQDASALLETADIEIVPPLKADLPPTLLFAAPPAQ
ncbi:Alpha/Beta hydrolase protein [Entophlyctis helioformis]|nr:Alpha/Beta hydrolase protein [Entophlyctis helioformis]